MLLKLINDFCSCSSINSYGNANPFATFYLLFKKRKGSILHDHTMTRSKYTED